MKRLMVFISLLCILASTGYAQNQSSKKQISDEERMAWWSEARFGMFIHWGIYSVPAGFHKGVAQTNSAEWIMNKGKIPLHEYEQYADQFNPTQFNPKTFVGLAKEAGMKYMVITSKHHDGFSMFHSKCNPFNVVDATPFKRDVLKELAEECAKQGIRFGFYYSQAQDWSHPGGMGNSWDKKMQRVSTDVYVKEKALPEVRQLLTEYGDIAIFWWDTPRKMSKEVIDSLYHITTDLQPGIITNDRLGEDYPGDHKTFERHLPKEKPEDKYWEICQPISGSWGYRSDDQNFKSVPTLIRNLADASSMGGNYLLNVSPTSLGTLAPTAVESLKAVGAWMDKNNEAIYGTEASPCGKPDWGYITMKKNGNSAVLYLHVFEWPKDGNLVVPLKNKPQKAYLLTNKRKSFKTKTSEKGIVISLTGDAPDAINSVVVLNLGDAPNAIPPKPFGQNKDGVVAFINEKAQFQNLQGPGAGYQSSKDCVAYWKSETAKVYWTFVVETPGTFNLSAETAGENTSEFTVSLAENSKRVKIPASGNYDIFKTLDMGKFVIDKAGSYTISFMPVAEKWNPVNMKNVVLSPEKN